MGRHKNPVIELKEMSMDITEAYDQDEMIDELDWAGYDFTALPVHLREGYWADCDFSGANAQGTKWNHAYLREANFFGADLRGADFYGAHLVGANFEGANLDGVSFEMANLTDANFIGCAVFPGLDAFNTAYVGRGSRERIVRRTGLPNEAIDLALESSARVIAGCDAQRVSAPYVRMDPAKSEGLDKE